MSSAAPFLQPLSTDGVSIVPRLEGDVLQVAMSGAVEMRDPGSVFNPYWNSLDDEVLRRGVKRVVLDLRNLNFMNSSGILTLVRWVTRAKGHGNKPYTIDLRYDRNVTWQRTSVPTLAKLAPEIVTATDING
jgi:hypothetical protein